MVRPGTADFLGSRVKPENDALVRVKRMSYRAIYSYAWDIAEVGVAAFADEVRALGLNTVTLAGAYHAGKFIRPHGRDRKGLFPRGRHRLFPRRPETLRPHQAGREQPQRKARFFPRARRHRPRGECLDGAASQHAAGPGLSRCDDGERLRRPLPLQPLPVLSRRPRIRCGALQGRHRKRTRHRHLGGIAGLRSLFARLSSRIRADEAEPLVR